MGAGSRDRPAQNDSVASSSTTGAEAAPKLIAYLMPGHEIEVRSAPAERPWMDATDQRFAYRCLPLTIANTYGWEILCPASFKAIWDGETTVGAIRIETAGDVRAPAVSHFGYGILTFHLPVLFRTEPGFDLLAQGPINRPKDAIAPLTGIIETDWAPYTFTMNWIFTQPEIEIEFEKGEPICHFFPVKRGGLESIEPEILPLSSNPDLEAMFNAWSVSRRSFNKDLGETGSAAQTQKWQKEYFRGLAPAGKPLAPIDHRTKLRLREFKRSGS